MKISWLDRTLSHLDRILADCKVRRHIRINMRFAILRRDQADEA
jgi:hypothetical protein